jgi:hypothetical protein
MVPVDDDEDDLVVTGQTAACVPSLHANNVTYLIDDTSTPFSANTVYRGDDVFVNCVAKLIADNRTLSNAAVFDDDDDDEAVVVLVMKVIVNR